MGIQEPQERRHGKRIPLSFHVEISGISLDGSPYCDQATASDVSDRGCQINLKRQIKIGDMLTLRVVHQEDPTADQQARFLYRAVWVEGNDRSWAAGLAALEPGNPWRISFPRESLLGR
jgi:PilZ domain